MKQTQLMPTRGKAEKEQCNTSQKRGIRIYARSNQQNHKFSRK